ncbi:hypothetical protein NC652_007070 [Populus alba x Populus x berolinensis]|nr:hypothetical protein NC652_007070 [Populus alba x Populus x berolinensis]
MDSSNLNRLYVNINMKRIKIGFRWAKLYPPFQVSVFATIGFNVETVQYNNIKFQVWDLGKPINFA